MEHIREVLKGQGLTGSKPVSEKRVEEVFSCSLCRDIEWLHPVIDGKVEYSRTIRCLCQKESDEKERQDSFLKCCNLPEKTKHKTFENFKTYGVDKLEEALRYSAQVAEGLKNVIFLTLLSGSDRGKSHLAIAACRKRLERGEAARYANVPLMLQEMRDGYDSEEYSYRQKLDFFCKVGLLALDDLGTEKVSEWGAEQIQTIINYRYDNALHTIVTTNRPLDDLFNHEDYPRESWRGIANMRVRSRLEREAWCKVVVIDTIEHMERIE